MGNTFQNAILLLSSSPAGVWLFSRVVPRIDRWTYQLSGNRSTLSSLLTGMPMVMVEVIGRKSGHSHLVPLLAVQRAESPNQFALIASNWGQEHYPAWYYNLLAKAEAQATLNGKTKHYSIHEAKDAEYQMYWETATNLFPNYLAYKRSIGDRRRIPILVLKPASD
jgi:deazaflavin-dependent oxidoreductase (nitroreductase family)